MEETWRKGEKMFVVALDIAKAFDNIYHASIVEALIQAKARHF